MPLFKSGAKKQGKEHKIWNQKVRVSRASMSIFMCKIPIATPILQDYCEVMIVQGVWHLLGA